MDNARRQDGRNGQPHNSVAGGNERNQALTGFEGMNYEQKRKPYRDGESTAKDENRNPGNNSLSGNNRGQ